MQRTHGKSSFCKKLRGALRRAFTITELVIVIAVIAILAAILIPTFSNVIESSKKSHDEQFAKEINIALSGYEAENGRSPEDYEELMLYLADYGLCDASNPFLLATKLKRDNYYLIWYEDTTSVILVDAGSSSDYIVQFTSSVGFGNAVYVFDKSAAGGTMLGYTLCTVDNPNGEIAAEIYRGIYIENGGNIGDFLNSSVGQAIENTVSGMSDASWGNSILASINNQKQGYSYNEAVANKILTQATSSSSISIGVTPPSDGEDPSGTQQSVRSALATLTRLANTSADAEVLQNKTITLAASDADNPDTALKGVVVDMSEVQMTAIGNIYRKDYEGKTDNIVDTGSFSVNFGGVEITNMTVAQNELVSSGAEFQEEKDCSYPGGAYVFTYGLFGTINAEKGQTVTISNLKVTDVNMNLTGATETVSGETYRTITDMAGVIAGYTQGNVVFENIEVGGANPGNGEYGEFVGFDGVAGIVGRAYSAVKNGVVEEESSLIIRNCTVSDLVIRGERRAAGFVGYAGNAIEVTIEDSALSNVEVRCVRSDGNSGIYSGLFGDFAGGTTLNIDNVTLTECDTYIATSAAPGGQAYEIWQKGFSGVGGLESCYYINPTGNNYLVYLSAQKNSAGAVVEIGTVSGFTIVEGGSSYTIEKSDMTRGTATTIA